MTKLPKILALDFGTKRIGVAISYGMLAEPLTILENSPTVFTEITQLLQEHAIEKIVLGISENTMAVQTKAFAKQLSQQTTAPIVFFDETLSSAEVHAKLQQTGKRHLSERGPIDHLAAAHILQQYLDENAGTSEL